MGDYLTSASTLMCPHGGSVSPVPGSGTVTLAGNPVLTSADSFPIAGCPFPPSGPPHPCIQVRWVVDALRGAASAATLTASACARPRTALCRGRCSSRPPSRAWAGCR